MPQAAPAIRTQISTFRSSVPAVSAAVRKAMFTPDPKPAKKRAPRFILYPHQHSIRLMPKVRTRRKTAIAFIQAGSMAKASLQTPAAAVVIRFEKCSNIVQIISVSDFHLSV